MKNKSILIFGGGKIGRSFIGQLFGLSGYEVIFSDVDLSLVQMLNQRRSYPVVIKADKEETLLIPHVRAIPGMDREKVVREVCRASLFAVSVGKNALEKIIPLLAEGLMKRYQEYPDNPLDIIIAENMRSTGEFMREKLLQYLPAEYPFDRLVGPVESSIGKMVPIMTQTDLEHDPLMVYAEPYNNLIVDKQGFKGKIPDVSGLSPKENIRAWVDRKAFIHNLGHVTVAYFGGFRHVKATYIYEILNDAAVYEFARKVMRQSAAVIQNRYPDDFSMKELEEHIDDLLQRFQNRALKDTVFRVGQDRLRKLGPDDRFMGVIRLAESLKMDDEKIIEAMVYAFYFNATDENGNKPAPDALFDNYLESGSDYVLQKVCGLDPGKDRTLITKILDVIRTIE